MHPDVAPLVITQFRSRTLVALALGFLAACNARSAATIADAAPGGGNTQDASSQTHASSTATSGHSAEAGANSSSALTSTLPHDASGASAPTVTHSGGTEQTDAASGSHAPDASEPSLSSSSESASQDSSMALNSASTLDANAPPDSAAPSDSALQSLDAGPSECLLGQDDADADGFTTADGDCDDCDPKVNPGAFDVPGNLRDDDCAGGVDDATGCDTALASDGDADALAKALDLCRTATLNNRNWGVLEAKLSLADGTESPSAVGHSIRPGFGSGLDPRLGASLVVLSTGEAAANGDTNPLFTGTNSSEHGQSSLLPADYLAAHAGLLPNAPGCPTPESEFAYDPEMLTLSIRTPVNARSFSLSASFYSYEFPEFVCSTYNDFFVALLDSNWDGTPANPVDRNLAMYTSPTDEHYPIGVNLAFGDTGLFQQCVNGLTGCRQEWTPGVITTCDGTSELAGTGFDTPAPHDCESDSLNGGATGWLKLAGNVVGGEVITLRLAIWDGGDPTWDSTVVLDGFTWSTELVTPGASQ